MTVSWGRLDLVSQLIIAFVLLCVGIGAAFG